VSDQNHETPFAELQRVYGERDRYRVALEEAHRVLTDWPTRADIALLIIRSALYGIAVQVEETG
jgi:hypothetical protein